MFAQKKVSLAPGRHKVIILDEADSMTAGAQQALRRTMELYASSTRFALACNLSSKIIEPIQSRCAMLRYTRLSDAEVLSRLIQVSEKEQVQYTPEGLEAILFTSEGDMRQAMNHLQSTCSGFGLVNAENVFKVCDQPTPVVLSCLVESMQMGNLDKALDLIKTLWVQGFSSLDIITTLFKIVKSSELPEYMKLEYIKDIGMTHMKLLQGHGSLLQLNALICRLTKHHMDPQVFQCLN